MESMRQYVDVDCPKTITVMGIEIEGRYSTDDVDAMVFEKGIAVKNTICHFLLCVEGGYVRVELGDDDFFYEEACKIGKEMSLIEGAIGLAEAKIKKMREE